jgi:hypothetical protein
MSSPSAPTPAHDENVQGSENVQDVSQAVAETEDDKKPAAEEEKLALVETVDISAVEDKPLDDSAATDPSADTGEDLQDVDIEEGRAEKHEQMKRASKSPSPQPSPTRRATAPMPKKKPLWLYMIIILVIISVIGALIITAVAATRGGLSKLALGFLIVFALVLVCVVPIACYTRANFFANGMIR